MNKVKAFIERGTDGTYGVYVDLNDETLNYGIHGDGATKQEAIDSFMTAYEDMKKSVTGSPAAMQHPWVQGSLAVTGKLRNEIMDLKQQVNKLEEENCILRGIIAKNITSPSPKRET